MSSPDADAAARRAVLVTGASGFIGRALCRHLADRGWAVTAAVRRDDVPLEAGIRRIVVGPVGPETAWAAALRGMDVVVHLAAHAHRTGERGQGDPAPYERVNHLGTRRLAEAVRDAGTVRRLVFLSSVAAVRAPRAARVDAASDGEPADPYGRSKRAAEAAIRSVLSAERGPDWTILRPPLVYGPGNPGNMARLLRLVETGLPLPLGAIHNRRSFLFLGNLLDVVERVLTAPSAVRRAFVLADAEAVSTPALVRRIARARGRRARVFPVPLPLLRAAAAAGDGVRRLTGRSPGIDRYALEKLTESLVVDAREATAVLGWTPPFTLDEGLRRTLEPVA